MFTLLLLWCNDRLQLRATYLEKVKAYRQDIAAGKVDWRSPDDAGEQHVGHSRNGGAVRSIYRSESECSC